jgi:hypothetical protein
VADKDRAEDGDSPGGAKPRQAFDPIQAENALHGERLIATARVALLVFRTIVMSAWAMAQAAPPPPGTARLIALPLYFVHCIAVLLVLRRLKPTSPALPWVSHVLNAIDYAFIVTMSAPAVELDPGSQRELLAMSIAIILSFSVARVGTAQAAVSTMMACASYLIGVRWMQPAVPAATAFVIGSFIASSTIALRVVVGLRRRASEATRLGQYTLVEKLGEGGMGIVYRATHQMLRRPTAVKLLQATDVGTKSAKGDETFKRFEREVQLTAGLSHPNTIAIYDYGRTPDGIFYYAMEYLEGANLEELVGEHGPQPPARVVHILRQICGSLGEAHGVGLIHRDIKPANLVLCERGGVGDVIKVLDFGLVKKVDSASNLGVTSDNVLTGTPLYLSPEAIMAPEKVDARSDLYAVGCVGYFLLTGEHVFAGKTLVEICSHHLHSKPVRPSKRAQRDIPRDVEDAILWCLAKEPADRPPSARALDDRLAECGCAGEWSDAEARRWWELNKPSISRLHVGKPLGTGERSLTIARE